MGYFFDGGFTGFLYSMKETGRELANGVKELVEDFVSGFNGRGWKLWKRNGSWRLELDELLVRKSLTVYDMIISKISAIKGSQAITQANAKIKSVSIVDSADVYEETVSKKYNVSFLDPKWEVYTENNNVSTLDITENRIANDAYVEYSQGFRVANTENVPSFTIEVVKFSGHMAYGYFDKGSALNFIFINSAGTYKLPASYGEGRVGSTGFIISENTIFEIIETSYTNVISEKIVKKPCYRIEIEDDINSVLEYDLLRCQKADRYYYVQVGSVFQYYINIPVSEFEVDADGNVLTPPEIGDELIQMGNASHQEKYSNRHSAIYLHVEEDEPIIDLMTDIYSKDWSIGNIIKTRIGGNLPNTDGDKGFYCVNGKLLFVDEIGQTISVINPDGSASFARGNISWTKDGIPEFKGYIISGNKDGKRIEINPEKGSIEIFDDESKVVNSIEGRKYLDQKEFFDSNTMDYVYNSSKVNKIVPFASGQKVTDTFTVPMFVYPEQGVLVTEESPVVLVFSRHYKTTVNSALRPSSLLVKFTLQLRNTADDSIIVVIEDEMTYSSETYNVGNAEFIINKNGYYIPEIVVDTTVVGGERSGDISLDVTISHASLVRIIYKSSFFSQGISLGDSPENMAMIWYKKKDNWRRGQIFMDIENGNSGIKINEYDIMVKTRSYSNMESHWLFLYPLVMVATFSFDGYMLRMSSSFGYELLNCTRKEKGIYVITWSDQTREYLSSYDLIIDVTPIDYNTSARSAWAYKELSFIQIYMYDSLGPVDGNFIIKIHSFPLQNGIQSDYKV